MELFTDEQYQQLIENGKLENRDKNHKPVVHLTLPGTRCEWLLSEIDPQEPDIAFGLCDLGMGFPELGYVSLGELQSVRHPVFDCSIYNNSLFEGNYPMSVYAAAAKVCGAICRKEDLLKKLYAMELINKQKKLRP